MIDQDRDPVQLVPCPQCYDEDDDEPTGSVGCYLCAGLLQCESIHVNPWPVRMVPLALAVEHALCGGETYAEDDVLLYMKHGGVWPTDAASLEAWRASRLVDLIKHLEENGVHVAG